MKPLARICAFFCCFRARSRLYMGPNLFRPPRMRSARTAVGRGRGRAGSSPPGHPPYHSTHNSFPDRSDWASPQLCTSHGSSGALNLAFIRVNPLTWHSRPWFPCQVVCPSRAPVFFPLHLTTSLHLCLACPPPKCSGFTGSILSSYPDVWPLTPECYHTQGENFRGPSNGLRCPAQGLAGRW